MSQKLILPEELELTHSQIEGMLRAGWDRGARVPLYGRRSAVCIGDGLWKVVDQQGTIHGFVKPENCVTSKEVREVFAEVVSR